MKPHYAPSELVLFRYAQPPILVLDACSHVINIRIISFLINNAFDLTEFIWVICSHYSKVTE